MTDHPNTLLRIGCRGFTIVELMVSMVIGLVIVLAVSQAALSNRATARSQTDISRIQENGQFAFDLMSRHIRNAGYQDEAVVVRQFAEPDNQVIAGVRVSNCSSGALMLRHPICGINNVGTGNSDVLQLRFFGHDNVPGTAASGEIRDCANNPIRAADMVEERFYVENNAQGIPSLFCAVITGAANIAAAGAPAAGAQAPGGAQVVELLPNVESMQLLYQFNSAANLQWARPIPGSASAQTNMLQAQAIRVSVLLRGENPDGTAATDNNTYDLFGPDYSTANMGVDPGVRVANSGDHRLRKVISFVANARNR